MKQTIVIDSVEGSKEYQIDANEKKTVVLLLINKHTVEGDVIVRINGEGAEVQILGAVIGSGKQQIRLHTVQDHRRPSGISDLLIKSVLFDQSRLYYEGLIKIEKDAQQSNAYQKNQNLLLSPQAWADSRPSLEILANDVRCTHGATVGTIDEEQLYYLASRGISRSAASRLIVEGFFSDVLKRIPDEKVQKNCREKIDKELQKLL